MAKKTKRSKKNKQRHKTDPKRRWMIGIMLVLLIPIGIGIIFSTIPDMKKKETTGPRFQKDGELSFMDSLGQENLMSIDIEIADNDLERNQGLMYRKSMEESQGMLFIMDREEMQSFWMLNTEIPLDMVFIDQDRRIVSIQKNVPPKSLESVPSTYPAKYVVEVIAGFCDKYHIKVGQKVEFNRI